MTKNDYLNKINEAINEHFRNENDDFDSDVYADDLLRNDAISLAWAVFLDEYVTEDYVSRVARFIFDTFKDINTIISPCKLYKR